MFLCSKNHYCENECTAKCNLHIQCYPIKVPMALFTELEPKFSQLIWKQKRPQETKAVLRKKNGAGVINLPDSEYMTKLQSSRQCGTGTKTEILTNGTRQKDQK